VNNGNLMLKHWHCVFNPEKELIRYKHLWVLMPRCLLVIWNLEVFKDIGNMLRKFLHVDSKVPTGSDMRMWKLLVEIDLFEGLSVEIQIVWHGTVIQ